MLYFGKPTSSMGNPLPKREFPGQKGLFLSFLSDRFLILQNATKHS